jgi:CheY-like chemotaxis protein
VVDDDAFVHFSLKMVIASLNIKAVHTNNGLEGVETIKKRLKCLKEHNFKLVILDMHMPMLNGPETAEEIRNICKE